MALYSDLFTQTIISLYGEKGQVWLDRLPDTIAAYAQRYNLEQLSPMSSMKFNYVARGYQKQRQIVVKLGLDEQSLAREAAYLTLVEGSGVEIIAYDATMLLMGCAVPGASLKQYFPDKDRQAMHIMCALVKKLHATPIPQKHDFPHIADILSRLDRPADIPHAFVAKACRIRDSLLASVQQDVLLHGDLHHDNILQHGDRWVIIDPKGYVGDPVFELAAYLSNPIPELLQHDTAHTIIAERIKICAQRLNFPEQRIKNWLYVKSVLCWAWALDDGLDAAYWKQFVGLLSS